MDFGKIGTLFWVQQILSGQPSAACWDILDSLNYILGLPVDVLDLPTNIRDLLTDIFGA